MSLFDKWPGYPTRIWDGWPRQPNLQHDSLTKLVAWPPDPVKARPPGLQANRATRRRSPVPFTVGQPGTVAISKTEFGAFF